MRPVEVGAEAFRRRQARLASWLVECGAFACVLEDFENQRSSSLRWLTGHPNDAIAFVFDLGKTVLVPWDVNLANDFSAVDQIIPYTDFKRSSREAVIAVLKGNGLAADRSADADGKRHPKVEFSARTSFLRHRELAEDLPDAEIVIRTNGVEAFLGRLRAVKDDSEIAAIEKAAEITNTLLDTVEGLLTSSRGADLSELDLAQLVAREALALGAEGMGFETLAAGPSRSWAIHPFPVCSSAGFGGPGLSILDFGVRVLGYTTDVTITVARGRLSPEQERMLGLVGDAYAAALEAAKPGASPQEPAKKADEVFTAAGWKMPHSLGHGIGLDAHEGPLLRSQGENPDPALLPGMVFTIEPALYHPDHGGARLENDVMIAESGRKVLTRAGIIRIR